MRERINMTFPPNVNVPEEYNLLAEAIRKIECELEHIYQDRADLADYDLPDAMYRRLVRAIDARARELLSEKTRYVSRQLEIEHEVLGDIPD